MRCHSTLTAYDYAVTSEARAGAATGEGTSEGGDVDTADVGGCLSVAPSFIASISSSAYPACGEEIERR